MQEDFDTQTSQPTSHYYHRKVSAHLPLGISRLSPKCICKPSTGFIYFVNSAPISCILEAKPNCGTRQSWKSNSNATVAMSNSTELVTHRWWKADLPHSLSAVLLAKRGCRKSDSGHQESLQRSWTTQRLQRHSMCQNWCSARHSTGLSKSVP